MLQETDCSQDELLPMLSFEPAQSGDEGTFCSPAFARSGETPL
jgi:hypothetical protein